MSVFPGGSFPWKSGNSTCGSYRPSFLPAVRSSIPSQYSLQKPSKFRKRILKVGDDNFSGSLLSFLLPNRDFKQLQSCTEHLLCWSVYLKRVKLILFDLFSSSSGIRRISSLYFSVLYLEFQSGGILK